jgi:hypothetical protein
MSIQVEPAVITEGFGNSNLTFAKKVTITDETKYEVGRSNNGGAYSFEKVLYYFQGENPKQGVYGYWRISYESNSSEFSTDSNGVFCDSLTYRNFGIDRLPLFKEQSHESESECGQETPADIWDYLIQVTEEEFLFAKNCVIYQEEGKRKISWEFGELDGYHQ